MMFDLTGIAISVLSIAFPIVSAFATRLITSQMKDQQAATVLGQAVTNSLGAMQQAAAGAIVHENPRMNLPALPAAIATGVQYVLEHAGPEAERLGISPETIATKITARLGLAAIATNLAIAASPSIATPLPLSPLRPSGLGSPS